MQSGVKSPQKSLYCCLKMTLIWDVLLLCRRKWIGFFVQNWDVRFTMAQDK
jgi:hypothetical protein